MAKSVKIKRIYKDGTIKFDPGKQYDSYAAKSISVTRVK